MPKIPHHHFMPPRSLKEFLEIYDYDVCDHANDACQLMASLASATSYSASHERKTRIDPETSNLVIEVQLTLEFTDPDRREAAKARSAGNPMPSMWGASCP
jgi:hypothetical protein